MPTSWLISGGCGFVGTNLADALLTGGESVVVLDNFSRKGAAENLEWLRSRHGDDFQFEQLDTRDKDRVAQLVKAVKPNAIAHLAGQVSMVASIERPRDDFDVNTIGTMNILDAIRSHSPETTLLYSSTNKVYGSLDHLRHEETPTRYVLPDFPLGLNETLQLDGHSPYGCSKLAADQYVRDAHRTFGLKTVVFRHSSMYGTRQFATYDQGWVGWFCQMALGMIQDSTPAFTISGDGKQVRDLLHADDLIRIYQLAAKRIDTCAGQIYNIGGGMQNSLSILELFEMLERLTGTHMRYTKLDWRYGDQKVFVADISKASKELGWFPQEDKESGIARMINWSKELVARQS